MGIMRGLALASAVITANAFAAITGSVFQDYNSNGVRDTTTTIANNNTSVGTPGHRGDGASPATIGVAIDRGLGNVTVTATCVTGLGADGIYGTADDARATYAAAVTAVDGTYTIATTSPAPPVAGTAANPACRVTFSWDSVSALVSNAPNPLYGMHPAFVGTGSNTATQFVNDGGVANLGLNYPLDYCQNNPTLVATCGVWGVTGASAGNTSNHLYSFPYSARSFAPNTNSGAAATGAPALAGLATGAQVGSVWGVAHHRPTGTVLVSSYLKRHVGVGPSGLGAIYSVNGATVGTLTNLETLVPGSSGADPRGVPLPGGYDFERDLGVLAAGPNLLIGKRGIGDIDFSDDFNTLYAVGLQSRDLYAMNVGQTLTAPASATTISLSSLRSSVVGAGVGQCPAETDVRPFGLKFYKGFLYVALTCTAESTSTNTGVDAGTSGGDATKLRAYVYRMTPGPNTFAQVANFTLNVPARANPDFGPWFNGDNTGEQPQPFVSDIEFVGQDIVIGVRDRFGDITSRGTLRLNTADTGRTDGRGHGDMYKACLGAAGTYDPANCATDGFAFYNDNQVDQNSNMGGLVQVPGFADIVYSKKDPNQIWSSGVGWNNNATGVYDKGYELLFSQQITGSQTANGVYFNGGKSSTIGDMEALCDAAPLEIGNRVWKDANNNGVQDPGEPPIAGVTVNLYAPGGTTLLATAVTDANGNYYFNNRTTDENGTALTQTNGGATVNAITGLTASTDNFVIRLDNPANYAAGGPLNNLFVATPNTAGATNDPLTDLTDSDATTANPNAPPGPGNFPAITFNTGGPGENNFGLDAGFRDPLFSLGNRVWFDTNNDGILNNGELPIAGVKVQLLDSGGNPIAGQTVVTDVNGYYRFDGLAAGSYSVRVTPDNWTGLTGSLPQGTTSGPSTTLSGAPLAGYSNSTPDNVATGTTAVNNTDKGVTPATAAAYTTNGVTSAQVTLGATPTSSQPTGDVDGGASGAGVNGPDGDVNDNLTVDFGFYRLTVGDTLWYDSGAGGGVRNDGIRNGTEAGLPAGVVVELLKNGVVVATTTTDTNGNYIFTQGTNAAGVPNGQPLVPGADYQVRVPAGQAALSGTTSSTNPTSLPTPTSPGAATNDDGDSGTGSGDAFAGPTTTANFTLGASTSPTATPDANGTYPVAQNGATNAGTNHKPNVDLGFAPPVYSLGNRIWFDANNDGLIDAAESGVDGVVVELLAETSPGSGTFVPTGTTLTTANGGYYRFDGLAAGNYRVRVNPSNFAAGGPLRGYFTSGTPTVNADGDANNDNNGLAPAAGNYVGLGVTSGTVALGGATLEPTNDNTEASGTATYNATNSNGTAAPDAQSNLSLDFGFHRVTIGNRVWLDTGAGANTNNGVFDTGELPVADGTVVTLVDNLGNVIATTTTTGGLYSFTTTTAGNPLLASGSPADLAQQFRVVITPPAGLTSSTPTSPVAAGNDERDHGTPTTTGGNIQSPNFTFSGLGTTTNGQAPTAATATTAQPQLDFGLVPTFSLGNRVWFDANNSGTVDGAEVGADGVTVELLVESAPGSGVFVSTPTPTTLVTANGGYYRFDGLAAGNYRVRVNASNFATGGPLRGYFTSGTPTANADGDANSDNNGLAPAGGNYVGLGVTSGTVVLGGATPEPTTDNTEAGTVGANTYNATNSNGTAAPDNQTNMTVDFGFHRVTIGNRIWFDTGTGAGQTNNGILDAGEAGVPDGTVVNLVDASGNVIATTTTTGGNGSYSFTTDTAGNPLLLSGSPADIARQFRVVLPTPPVGSVSSNPDFPVAAGNDSRDHGAPGTGGAIQTPLFTVTPGVAGGTANDQTVTTATATTEQPQLDIGLVPQYSLGNRVWLDTNGDGIRQPTEPGRDGVVVNLQNSSGQQLYRQADGSVGTTVTANPMTTTTSGGGYYRFDGLPPGDYVVQLAPSNFQPGGALYSASTSAPLATTTTNVGGVDGVDNNSNGVSSATPATSGVSSGVVTLGNGGGNAEPTGETDLSPSGQGSADNRADMTVDFGFVPVTFALGNTVFIDANNNGTRDGSEAGLPGVTVNLYADANGDGVPDGPALQTTTTNGSGQYLFSGLPEGNYVVEISGAALAGYTSSTGVNGGLTGPYEPGSTNFTAAGNNLDHGGTVSPGVIRSGTVTLGAGMPTGEGGDLTVTDPNATPDNRTNLTVDFGVFQPASLGSVVWIDNGTGGGVSGDGIKQANEPGIPGVTVILLDSTGNPVDGDPATPGVQQVTAVTGPNGQYQIMNLAPGTYQVQFVFPANSTITLSPNPPGSGNPPTNPGPGGLDNQFNEMDPNTRRSPPITLAPGQDNPNLDSGVLSFSSTVLDIPTLRDWMLLLLALLIFATGATAMRRGAKQ